jgi:glutamine synthetase
VNTKSSGALKDALDATGARLVECCVADFSSNARGKTVGRDDFLALGGCKLASVVLGLTLVGENAHDLFGRILPSSFEDVSLVADPATLIGQIGRPRAATVLCEPHGHLRAERSGREYDANELSPRGALRRVLARLERAGYTALVAPELEFYLFNRRPGGADNELVAASPHPGSPVIETGCEADSAERAGYFAPYFDELFDACEAMRIPVTGYAHESAISQFEVNFRPGEPLRQADAVFRFKRLARQVAARHGFLASFLAKPFLDQPGAGMHWHFSLQHRADGRNAFLADDSDADGPRLRHFVAGLQRHAQAATALYAPYDNSYDRIVRTDSSPSRATWGLDDRLVAFRIPASSPANRRVENRLPGADASPYLIVAATLGLGLAGIEHGWEPQAGGADLPASLGRSLDTLEADTVLRSVLGEVLVDFYCGLKRCESGLRNAVADPRANWDLRYLTEQA